MVITEEQKSFFKNHIENLDELLSSDDVNDVLLAIDDAIVDNILENDEEPDEVGIKLQRLYDEIYNGSE